MKTQLTDKLIVVIVPEVKDNKYFKVWDGSERKEWIIECQHENGDVSIVRDLGNILDYKIIGTITKEAEFDWVLDDFSKGVYLETLKSKGISLEKLDNQKLLILKKS